MDKDKKLAEKKPTLAELMKKVVEYNPTLEDLILELTPEEKLLLGVEVGEEKNNDRKG